MTRGAKARTALTRSPGQAGDNPMLEPVLTEHQLYDRRPFRLLADKAYSHPSTRRLLPALAAPVSELRGEVERVLGAVRGGARLTLRIGPGALPGRGGMVPPPAATRRALAPTSRGQEPCS